MGQIAFHDPIKNSDYQIHGRIVNDKPEPVPFATISADGKFTIADSLGYFTTSLSVHSSFTVSCVGYEQKSFTTESINNAAVIKREITGNKMIVEMDIELKQQQLKVPDAIVTGYRGTFLTTRLGGVSSTVTRRSIFPTKGIVPAQKPSQLKIFPNPVQPGQSFRVTMQVKKTGNYILKIVDVTGRILLENKTNMLHTNYTETVRGTVLQQPSVYFLSLSNPADKKDRGINGRLVVA